MTKFWIDPTTERVYETHKNGLVRRIFSAFRYGTWGPMNGKLKVRLVRV